VGKIRGGRELLGASSLKKQTSPTQIKRFKNLTTRGAREKTAGPTPQLSSSPKTGTLHRQKKTGVSVTTPAKEREKGGRAKRAKKPAGARQQRVGNQEGLRKNGG